MGTIYLIENIKNGKKYVGQTIRSLKKRISAHFFDSGHLDSPLYRAIRKYGKHTFKVSPLVEDVAPSDLDRLETEFIISLNTLCPNGYNVCLYSRTRRGIPHSNETKLKIGNGNRGKTRSREVRDRISSSLSGRPSCWAGRKHKESSKIKISKSMSGRKRKPFTREHRDRIALARIGRPTRGYEYDKSRLF